MSTRGRVLMLKKINKIGEADFSVIQYKNTKRIYGNLLIVHKRF